MPRPTRRTLSIPADAQLDPTVVRIVLAQKTSDAFGLSEQMVKEAVALAKGGIRQQSSQIYDVGGRQIWTMHRYEPGEGMYVTSRCMECDCFAGECSTRIALLLALLWEQDHDIRQDLQQPLWRLTLNALMGAHTEVAVTSPETFIYVLRDPRLELSDAQERKVDSILGVTRWRTRTSAKSGKALKPQKSTFKNKPDHWGMRPTAADEAVAMAYQVGASLVELLRKKYYDPAYDGEEMGAARHGLYKALAAAPDVRLGSVDGPRITFVTEPVHPGLKVTKRGKSLQMSWDVEPLGLYPSSPPWVLLDGMRLAPLGGALAHVVERAGGLPMLPEIPEADVPAFVSEGLPHLTVPVDLSETELVTRAADAPMRPQILLVEADDTLTVDMRASYRLEGVEAVVSVSEPHPLLTFDTPTGPQLLQRQRQEEAAAAEQVSRWVGPLPSRLEGEAAFDFLFEGLPSLQAQGFEIRGDTALAGKMVRTPLTSKVRVESGLDWFDLEVAFEAEGVSVPLKGLMKTRRLGRRYHQLSNGRVVRLPEAWLARHAENAEALDELRGRRKRIGSYAAPLAAELLEEAGDEIAAEVQARLQSWRERVERLSSVEGVPPREVPKGFHGELRDYQQRGFRWLTFLKEIGFGGVLADDMGLGKTVQVLAALQWAFEQRGRKAPALVVAPTSVVYNWAQEAARFTPDLAVKVHHGKPRETEAAALKKSAQIVITSYPILRQDAELLSSVKWGALVLDEAQAIKNPSSQIAQTVRGLKASWRLALTGTPLENDLFELWSLFEALMPGFFASQRAFNDRYAKPIHKDQSEDAMADLRRRVRPFILRRLKSEVALELPPRTEQLLYCELEPPQQRVYDGVREAWRDRVMSSVQEKGVGRSSLEILEALMRLRQAACDVHLLPVEMRSGAEGAAKLDLLQELLEPILAEGHKALIFSQWPSLLRRVVARLDADGVDHLYLDGSTKERQKLVERFNTPEGPPLFLISLKAGGTGLNLTAADHVIHLDPWWNPAAEAQATDRAHRIGQTRPVTVYKLVARGTVEEKIVELQARKRALFEAAVDQGRVMVDTLSREDLEAVFASSGEATASPQPAPSPSPAVEVIPPAPEALTPPALPSFVVETIERQGHLTTTLLATHLASSSQTARNRLKEWVSRGLLVRRGAGRGVKYYLP